MLSNQSTIDRINEVGKKGYVDIQYVSRNLKLGHDRAVLVLNELGYFRREDDRRKYYLKESPDVKTKEQKIQENAEQVLSFFQDRDTQKKEIKAHVEEGKGLCISSYILGTKIHEGFWNNLLSYCEVFRYKLVVIPQKFRNPTVAAEALLQIDEEEMTNDPRVIPYLLFDRMVFDDLKILADIRVQPTAITPYTGLVPLSEGRHLVLGHATQHLVSLPRMLPELPRLFLTTGSVSELPAIENVAAKRYENDHAQGAVIYEPDCEIPLRHIHADSEGFFYDYGFYAGEDVRKSLALYSVWGDIHVGQEDKTAIAWAIETTKEVGASIVYLNDTFDGQTVNPHIKHNVNRYNNFSSIAEEVDYHNNYLRDLSLANGFSLIRILSNHDDMLKRASNEMRLSDCLCKEDAEILFKVFMKDETAVLHGDTLKGGTVVNGFQLIHGHESFNGARASKKSYANLGHRTIHNHTHQPSLARGHFGNGCLCKLEQEYTKGSFTSWAFSIVNVYPGHKAQLLVYISNGDLTQKET